MVALLCPNMVSLCCVHHILLRRQSCTIRSPTLHMKQPIINLPVPTTHLLFIPLTNPAWLGSFDPPMSQNPPCHPRLALHHLPTPMTLKHNTHLPPLRQATRLEIGWDLLPSIPTQGSLSMGLLLLLMVFMLHSMTAGEYGGLSCITERMPGVTHCLQRCCIPLSTSLHSGRDSTL